MPVNITCPVSSMNYLKDVKEQLVFLSIMQLFPWELYAPLALPCLEAWHTFCVATKDRTLPSEALHECH